MMLAPRPSPPFSAVTNHRLPLFPPKPINFRRLPNFQLPAAFTSDVDSFTNNSGYLFQLSDSEADSMTEYNIKKINAFYRDKPLVVLRRLFQIGTTLGKWVGLRYLDSISDRSEEMFKVRAAELRNLLVELGPAYIKIAQAISSRPDIIPPSYVDELSLLQDQISPFATELAFDTIEKELGLPINELFSEISPDPVAAASLGQVYQARLQSTGQLVAIKVQRPGVQAAISVDILILRYLAGVIRRVGKFNSDLQEIVDEWASSLFREMDYRNEAKNGLRFRELYGDLKDVMVPIMFEAQTTRKVLTMQWIEGKKLAEVKDLYIVEVGVYCSLVQLLEHGFYHADPHPGNLLRTSDGKLAYLDFGMMGDFKEEFRDGFIEACLHLINRDYDELAKDFVSLGLIPPGSDKDAVSEALTGLFTNAIANGVDNVSFGDLFANLGKTMYKFKFRIPSYFSLVIRSLAVLEGIAYSFNPKYKVLGGAYPWIARKVLTNSSPQLKASLQQLLYKGGVFRIDRLESLVAEALRARTEETLGTSKLEEGDVKVVVKQILAFVLTEKGAFVRELLVQELAKGLDALGLATLDSVTSAAASNLPFGSSISISSMKDEDVINLRNLYRLLHLLKGIREDERTSVEAKVSGSPQMSQKAYTEVALAVDQFSPVQDILPLLSIITELPLDMQRQLLFLPADLAGKLLSRVTARTLQRAFL
ncbi:putative aarF domain-containing protein kinase [Heracleum sosnowskyi]|uniref:AarF domain-containing protein kinase n=1 Tax=Heracleum sosnowskyi TaxID=360622 RepID=A0AAD8JIH7_9APIA|nr:putative aarF domain-containing protein kinase [Heracleum sosnowskyi]